MLDLSGISLPFGVGDMISGGMSLIGLVGGFVVIALAIIFAPHLIEFVKLAFWSHKVGKVQKRVYNTSYRKAFSNEFAHHTKWKYSKKYRNGE